MLAAFPAAILSAIVAKTTSATQLRAITRSLLLIKAKAALMTPNERRGFCFSAVAKRQSWQKKK